MNPSPTILEAPVFAPDTADWLKWKEAYNAWLDAKRRKSGSENTAATYAAAWQQFFTWCQAKPWDVSGRLAQQWAALLAGQGNPATGRKLSPASVNLKLAALSSFYSFAQNQYNLRPVGQRNPFRIVERAKISPFGRSKYPTTAEAQAIMGAINTNCLSGKRDLALLLTYLVSCRRSAEILNLCWGDIQPGHDGNYIFVYRAKGGKIKKAVLHRHCYDLIVDYLSAAGRLKTIAADDFIFMALDPTKATRLPHITCPSTGPLTNSMVNQLLKKYAARAGVHSDKAHLHGLRHAGGRMRFRMMKQNGTVDLFEIMHLLGHKTVAITQIYVTEVLEDPLDRGARAAVEVFLPTLRPKKRTNGGINERQY